MNKLSKILFVTLFFFSVYSISAQTAEVTNSDNNTFTGNNSFTKNIRLEHPKTSPNLILKECDTNISGCNDTYSNMMFEGPDGKLNTLISSHRKKGSTNPPETHDHFMIRLPCGSDESDITSCGRIECDIYSDHPICEFRNIDIYINPANGKGEGAIYMRSPNGNKWRISIDNNGNLTTTDENPPTQPVLD